MAQVFSQSGVVQLSPKLVDGLYTYSQAITSDLSLKHGTASGQANAYWSGTLTLASGADQTIDLLSLSLTALNLTGTVGFAEIKTLIVANQSANVTLAVDPGATHGWGPLGGLKVGKSGVAVLHSPVAGLAVGSTSREVTITNEFTAPSSLTGTLVSASTAVTALSSTSTLAAGMTVTGTGVPSGTTIASITSSTAIVLSKAATAGGTGVTLSFDFPSALVDVFVAGVLD